ncbi:hypothetical protein KIN20_025647 [Parelaphostrongylus tenuis]|uniref:Cytochrome b5 heme-binding domain-containing protein n=1 Tax=Parelaphostrongylus tenuis TaxID=148309 RepID=A0AAD5NDF6_PARTN|nr:hypothetical protein KIN20_025647 [Parelaphostrongylus tenuis]
MQQLLSLIAAEYIGGAWTAHFRRLLVKRHDRLLFVGECLVEYSLNEVARHCVADDLWIVFNGKVYNMTSYLDSHPGGKAMLRQAGKDATNAMKLIQSHNIAWGKIEKILEDHQVGTLKR